MQGTPVFPIMMRYDMTSNGHVAGPKEIMESGVRVNPKSVKAEDEVKMALYRGQLDRSVVLGVPFDIPPGPALAI
jgi:hypothetical protein